MDICFYQTFIITGQMWSRSWSHPEYDKLCSQEAYTASLPSESVRLTDRLRQRVLRKTPGQRKPASHHDSMQALASWEAKVPRGSMYGRRKDNVALFVGAK
ncbi:hypothetical protein KCV07_g423, partial [Aureobasidium melanogenum]